MHGDCDWRNNTQGEHYVMIGDLVFHTFLHVSSFTRPMVESAVSNLCLAGMSSGFFVQPFSKYFHVVFHESPHFSGYGQNVERANAQDTSMIDARISGDVV